MSGPTPTANMGWSKKVNGLRARYSPTTGGPNYLFEYDPQGSLVQRQTGGNTSYSALDTAMYDAYGSKLGDKDVFTGTDEPVRDAVGFQGQFGAYTDNETGLVLMGHRYYSPGTGRFLTRDPMGYKGGINLYGFTGNNPVNESDADGLISKRRIRRELDPNAYDPLMESLSDARLTNDNVAKVLDPSHGGNSASTHNPVAIYDHKRYGAAVDIDLFHWDNRTRIRQVINILAEHGFASWYRNPGVEGTPKKWRRHIHAVYAGSNLDLSTGGLQLHRQVQDYFHEPHARNGFKHHLNYKFYNFDEDDKEAVRRDYFEHNRMH